MSNDVSVNNVDLSSFIDWMRNAGKDESYSPLGPKFYVAQQNLSDVPALQPDLGPPPTIVNTGKASHYGTNLWLCSSAGSESPCHHDPYQNILCQIFGEKEVILFAPSESEKLYPAYGTLQKNTSLVDFENPDFDSHPLFLKAVGYRAVLQKGDAVFIPKGWWHYCRAKEESCSVNFWWL
jgi:lysine-specific demethylase 8